MDVEKGNMNEACMSDEKLKQEILRLKKEKNAVILAHYYQKGDIQDIADYIGDSLALAQIAERIDAPVVVMCGVHFMGETTKILCPADKFAEFVEAHPGYEVISYVNTSAAVKAHTDVVVTSSNARAIVESFPADAKLIFGPDRNLGSYINSVTGRNMLLWDGACHVHEQFSLEKLVELKKLHPQAKVLVHPECKKTVVMLADKVGSTAALLKYAIESDATEFIVATESGILHEMKKKCPGKVFIPLPPADSTCGCNDCNFMKLNTLRKVYDCLLNERPFIEVEETLAEKARRPIRRMLEMSKALK